MTSVSERCSAVIVEGNALPVLYDYIERSNRSRATLEVVKVCLQILINVMKVRYMYMYIHVHCIYVHVHNYVYLSSHIFT